MIKQKDLQDEVRVVVFDFDDTMYVWDRANSWDEFMFKNLQDFYGKEKFDELNQKLELSKQKNLRLVIDLLRQNGEDIKKLEKFYRTRIFQLNDSVQVISQEFLKWLKEKYHVWVVSMSAQNYLSHYFKKFGIKISRFRCRSCVHHKEIYKKEILQKIIAREKCKPHQLVMIGDSLGSDITPAKELGTKTIHFKGDFQQIYDFFGWSEPQKN